MRMKVGLPMALFNHPQKPLVLSGSREVNRVGELPLLVSLNLLKLFEYISRQWHWSSCQQRPHVSSCHAGRVDQTSRWPTVDDVYSGLDQQPR